MQFKYFEGSENYLENAKWTWRTSYNLLQSATLPIRKIVLEFIPSEFVESAAPPPPNSQPNCQRYHTNLLIHPSKCHIFAHVAIPCFTWLRPDILNERVHFGCFGSLPYLQGEVSKNNSGQFLWLARRRSGVHSTLHTFSIIQSCLIYLHDWKIIDKYL